MHKGPLLLALLPRAAGYETNASRCRSSEAKASPVGGDRSTLAGGTGGPAPRGSGWHLVNAQLFADGALKWEPLRPGAARGGGRSKAPSGAPSASEVASSRLRALRLRDDEAPRARGVPREPGDEVLDEGGTKGRAKAPKLALHHANGAAPPGGCPASTRAATGRGGDDWKRASLPAVLRARAEGALWTVVSVRGATLDSGAGLPEPLYQKRQPLAEHLAELDKDENPKRSGALGTSPARQGGLDCPRPWDLRLFLRSGQPDNGLVGGGGGGVVGLGAGVVWLVCETRGEVLRWTEALRSVIHDLQT